MLFSMPTHANDVHSITINANTKNNMIMTVLSFIVNKYFPISIATIQNKINGINVSKKYIPIYRRLFTLKIL